MHLQYRLLFAFIACLILGQDLGTFSVKLNRLGMRRGLQLLKRSYHGRSLRIPNRKSVHGRHRSHPNSRSFPSGRCPTYRFTCKLFYQCISTSKRCDGRLDCWDWSDEIDCVTCHSYEFECNNGGCVPLSFRCDGFNDCGDESDERFEECGSCDVVEQFACRSSGRCIWRDWSCDHYVDCLDHSDENYCGSGDYNGIYNYGHTSAPISGEETTAYVSTEPAAVTTVPPTTPTPVSCDWSSWGEWTLCTPNVCYAERRKRTRSCPCGDGNCPTTGTGDDTAIDSTGSSLGDREFRMCPLQNCPPDADSGCGTHVQLNPFFSARIVGGETAAPGEWPWQAQLRVRDSTGLFELVCGGSLVDWRFVVTAAHCFAGSINPADWIVILGRHNADTGGTQFTVSAIVPHKDFDARTSANDLAILVLSEPAEQSHTVNTVCLDEAGEKQFGTESNCYITGWGYTSHQGATSATLQEANVPLIPNDVCSKPEIYGQMVLPTMQCAGYLEGGVDSCQGDSGGPLVCTATDSTNGKARYYLVGATSWGISCADVNNPGVYTKISNFTTWLRETMNLYVPS